MKKKLLAMVLAAATAMTMLAGCGGGGEKEAPEEKDVYKRQLLDLQTGCFCVLLINYTGNSGD